MRLSFQAVGADPEVFIINKHKQPISAEGKLGGTKEKPKPMEGLPDGFFIQEDNVAAEFNIPPAVNGQDFTNKIHAALGFLRKKVAPNLIKVVPAMHFPENQLQTEHTQRLGCDPDFDIWALRWNPRPVAPKTLRTAAGHVHISWKDPTDEQRKWIGRLCDVYLGLPSLFIGEQNERRMLYGRAGAVRLKPYGVEYRTLDNTWLLKKEHHLAVFAACQRVVYSLERDGDYIIEELEGNQGLIQEAINHHKLDLASALMHDFNVPAWV